MSVGYMHNAGNCALFQWFLIISELTFKAEVREAVKTLISL